MENIMTFFPFESIRFLRTLMIIGLIGGALITVPAGYALYESWHEVSICTTTLQLYHIQRIALFVVQVPIRTYICHRLGQIGQTPGRQRNIVVQKLIELCHSRVWHINQVTGMIVYMFFFPALIFSWHYFNQCMDEAPFLFQLCCMNLVIFVLHMAASYSWLRRLINRQDVMDLTPWTQGASEEEIQKYTTLTSFGIDKNYDHTKDDMECTICIDKYERNDPIRVLPCKHHYHAECIDKWLVSKRACPLCQRCIDAPPRNFGNKQAEETKTKGESKVSQVAEDDLQINQTSNSNLQSPQNLNVNISDTNSSGKDTHGVGQDKDSIEKSIRQSSMAPISRAQLYKISTFNDGDNNLNQPSNIKERKTNLSDNDRIDRANDNTSCASVSVPTSPIDENTDLPGMSLLSSPVVTTSGLHKRQPHQTSFK